MVPDAPMTLIEEFARQHPSAEIASAQLGKIQEALQAMSPNERAEFLREQARDLRKIAGALQGIEGWLGRVTGLPPKQALRFLPSGLLQAAEAIEQRQLG